MTLTAVKLPILFGCCTIQLTRGLNSLVSEHRFAVILGRKWHAHKMGRGRDFYAARTERTGGKKRTILMHRYVTGAAAGTEVDHKDGDTRNNTDNNLRVCGRLGNSRNLRIDRKNKGSSRYKGVFWYKRLSKWMASITHNGKFIYIGVYSSEEEAARAYDASALRRFGEFARTNFPADQYEVQAA